MTTIVVDLLRIRLHRGARSCLRRSPVRRQTRGSACMAAKRSRTSATPFQAYVRKKLDRVPDLPDLALRLRERGLDEASDRVSAVAIRFQPVVEQFSWLVRNRARVAALLSRHAGNVRVEAKETAHLFDVARRLVVERQDVSIDDRSKAREQLLDLLKSVPASAILTGTFLIPIPGAQPILAPILMERLGLLPSAWAESDLEKELRDLIDMAARYGNEEDVGALAEALVLVRDYAAKIAGLTRFVRDNPHWNVFFDGDLNQRITRQDMEALRARVRACAAAARDQEQDQDWFVMHREARADVLGTDREDECRRNWGDPRGGAGTCDLVSGPMTIRSAIDRFGANQQVLVRKGIESWWIPLSALLKELESLEMK